MRDLISFLKTKTFFKHFALALLSLAILIFLMFKLLDVYTNHGETVAVPDFKGQTIAKLDQFIEGKDVQYQIIDSIYSPGEKPGIVIRQDPEPKIQVKHNRTIYLYVTSVMPPQIEMPKFVDRSMRQALAMVESYGLKAKVKTVPGDCDGCVLWQVVDGKKYTNEDFKAAKKPVMIKKGTVIELYIGEGESDARVTIPDLTGMSLQEAIQKLNANGLVAGLVLPDERSNDSLNMNVYKQFPPAGNEATIKVGSGIDLYITKDPSKLEN